MNGEKNDLRRQLKENSGSLGCTKGVDPAHNVSGYQGPVRDRRSDVACSSSELLPPSYYLLGTIITTLLCLVN